MVPQVNGVSYMGKGNPLYAWISSMDTVQIPQHMLTYPTALYLSNGDTFRLVATAVDSVIGQQFSAHYIGDTVLGFSARYTGTYSFQQFPLGNSAAAGRTLFYSQGDDLSDISWFRPSYAGAYQV